MRAADLVREQLVNADAVWQVFHEFRAPSDEAADPYLGGNEWEMAGDRRGRLPRQPAQGRRDAARLFMDLDDPR